MWKIRFVSMLGRLLSVSANNLLRTKYAQRRISLLSAISCLALVSSGSARAGTIEVGPPSLSGGSQIEEYEPIGQTFTAIDANVVAGLYFSVINPGYANSDPIRYDLYSGEGTGGGLLGSSTFSVATGFYGYYMVDFSAFDLVIGDTYSLVASVVGSSPHWAIRHASDVYAGGVAIFDGSFDSHRDQGFRVVGCAPTTECPDLITEPVPEPTTALLLACGLVGLAVRRRLH